MTPNLSHVAGLQFALDTHIIGDLRARKWVEEIIQQAKSATPSPDAELVELLKEARDLATAVPVLMLAIPNPSDVESRSAHIDSVNALIDRIDAKLASREVKP